MKWMKSLVIAVLFTLAGVSAEAASAKVLKVLPHLLDQEGRHTLSPSLYERDAYQAKLRKERALVSTIRFDINWKASSVDRDNIRVRVETRGDKPGKPMMFEEKVKPGVWFSTWSKIAVPKEAYQQMQAVTAWRITIWNGEEQLAEQKSFLW
jgi:hypothetical protein